MNKEVLDVAKYVITKCYNDDKPISNLQLQKILYFIQYSFIEQHRQQLFEEDFEAWQFGPVVPKIYHEFKRYGSMPITKDYDISNLFQDDDDNRNFIDNIINNLREFNK